MSLWGKTDTAADAPKNLSAADADKIYLVDTTEAAVASNKAKGLGAGWNTYTTYVDANGNTRHKSELLVAMSVTAGTAGDVGAIVLGADQLVASTNYQIITAGTTDFTLVGAANNNVGVVFTATGAGTGTGTVRPIEDDVVADS